METITNSLFSVDLLNQPGADLMLGFATKLLAGVVTIIIGFWLAGRASRLVVDSISKIDRIDKTIMPIALRYFESFGPAQENTFTLPGAFDRIVLNNGC